MTNNKVNPPTARNMACFHTNLPLEIINSVIEELERPGLNFQKAGLIGGNMNDSIRNCEFVQLQTYNWIGGFIWHYLSTINRDNYLYDITSFEQESFQYLVYKEGDFYTWHVDQGLEVMFHPKADRRIGISTGQHDVFFSGEQVRKLSFSLQLTSPEEYTGGDLQILTFEPTYPTVRTAPKGLGSLVIFDSRLPHRVTKVKSGTRKAIVGWVVGPRWK